MRTSGAGIVLLGFAVAGGVCQGTSAMHANGKSTSVVATAVPTEAYVIGVEDVLSVSVWKEPEVSGSMPVRPDGKISLPLLNDVQASGLTPIQLADEITVALKKYVESPMVTVTVTAMNSRRIYFTGQIARTGAMPLLKDMTVMEALASAGCCMEFAKVKKIYVLRIEDGRATRHPFNYKDALKGRNTDQNIVLKAGDTIVVP